MASAGETFAKVRSVAKLCSEQLCMLDTRLQGSRKGWRRLARTSRHCSLLRPSCCPLLLLGLLLLGYGRGIGLLLQGGAGIHELRGPCKAGGT